jgi:molybdopterin converting factor small subunit
MSATPQVPMQVTVHLFAGAAAAVGSRHLEIGIPTGSCLSSLVSQMEKSYPQLRRLLPHSRWAVGNRFVPLDYVLTPQDLASVAMIPPVSGG